MISGEGPPSNKPLGAVEGESKPRICPICGSEISGAMESCPVCIFREALASGAEAGESYPDETVKQTAEHVAQRFEHYELVLGEDGRPIELGRGAMGVTYKAFDIDLRCPVALKVIGERYLGDESHPKLLTP